VSLYDRLVVPRLISLACSAKPIRYQRLKVVPHARGRVLELGIGGGLNLTFYDPTRVERVIGIDPSEGLRRRAEQAPRAPGLEVEIRDGAAETLPFESATFDTIVCTFTLCSVHDPAKVLSEARRVLKPGGAFLFSEHGLAPDAGVQRWQRRIEPVWKRLAGGCHLTRPPAGSVAAAGFALVDVQTMYLPGTPRAFGWAEWGEARAR
jgi:ubiquinone/menaquinone biosynthesis C-methylase UbiE